MTTIIVILLIAVVLTGAMILIGRIAPAGRVPVAASVMLGVAAYLLAGWPGVAGAPVARVESAGFGDALDDPRQGMAARFGDAAQWLAMSDGMIRGGRTEMAAHTLAEGVRRHPRNVDLWVGYGNALVAHAGGVMTPASAMAFDRAADIDPTHPAPPFFAGLALAQGGDVAGARAVWQELLTRSPADAPWRADLERRLAMMPPAPASPAAPAANAPPAPAPSPAPTASPAN